jgi:hypothetical protein
MIAGSFRHLPRRRPRGFATILVIATLPVVGAAMLAVAILVAQDARRTASASRDAQARQLLLAGGVAVLEKSNAWTEAPTSQSFDVNLPAALADVEGGATVKVSIARDGMDNAIARVDATYANNRTSQFIHVRRGNGTWRVVEIRMDGPSE